MLSRLPHFWLRFCSSPTSCTFMNRTETMGAGRACGNVHSEPLLSKSLLLLGKCVTVLDWRLLKVGLRNRRVWSLLYDVNLFASYVATHDVHVEATRVIAVENVYERVSSFFFCSK